MKNTYLLFTVCFALLLSACGDKLDKQKAKFAGVYELVSVQIINKEGLPGVIFRDTTLENLGTVLLIYDIGNTTTTPASMEFEEKEGHYWHLFKDLSDWLPISDTDIFWGGHFGTNIARIGGTHLMIEKIAGTKDEMYWIGSLASLGLDVEYRYKVKRKH